MLLKNKGMTIVEILIASLILSIVLMGYIQTQMRSIINTEYSNRANLISSTSEDFSSLVSNFIINEKEDDDKQDVIDNFKLSNWSNNNYDEDLDNCKSELEIDDADYCTRDMMIDFLVKSYKEGIQETIPDAQFSLNECSSTDNLCLIVSWSGESLEENSCRISTSNCFVTEISK